MHAKQLRSATAGLTLYTNAYRRIDVTGSCQGIARRRRTLAGVLRLTDARAAQPVEVPATAGGLLRICAHLPPESSLLGLRVLLVADLLVRIVELLDAQAMLAVVGTDESHVAALEHDTDPARLGIHPPVVRTTPGGELAALGGPARVVIGRTPEPDLEGVQPIRVEVGEVRPAGADVPPAGDPLAVRFALLTSRHQDPVDLAADGLADAEASVARWRGLVAGWAEEPSRPMPPEVVRRAYAALGDDLDTAAVIATLRDLETEPEVAAGAKFETFVHLDRVLGLDLARDIGRGPRG